MAIGNKYTQLTEWLQNCGKDRVRLSFEKLNTIIQIPNYAYKDRPSWANLSKPSSFCSSWINAGYIVSAISLQEQWVEFSRGEIKGRTVTQRFQLKQTDNKAIAVVLQCGYDCYNDMSQSCNSQSLMALGKLYMDRKDEFDALCKYCSNRIEYPAAKVIDMCFFEYGLRNDSSGEK